VRYVIYIYIYIYIYVLSRLRVKGYGRTVLYCAYILLFVNYPSQQEDIRKVLVRLKLENGRSVNQVHSMSGYICNPENFTYFLNSGLVV
jgi:hypothetical protein